MLDYCAGLPFKFDQLKGVPGRLMLIRHSRQVREIVAFGGNYEVDFDRLEVPALCAFLLIISMFVCLNNL